MGRVEEGGCASQYVCKGPEVGMDQALVKSKMKGRVVEHREPRGEEPRMKGVWQGPDPVRLVECGQEFGFRAEGSRGKCARRQSGGLQGISDTGPQITCVVEP